MEISDLQRSDSGQGRLIKESVREQLLAKELLDLLEQLLAVDSQSQNVQGIFQLQQFIAQRFKVIGGRQAKINWIYNSQNDHKLLHMHWQAPRANAYRIAFIAHVDTVLPYARPSYSKDQTGSQIITAPGCSDNKGGVVIACSGIAQFLASHPQANLSFDLIISPNEEVGSPGFQDYFLKLGQKTNLALGFEPALENGDLICQRRGNRWYNIKVTGKEEHTGRALKQTSNAAHAFFDLMGKALNFAHKISDLGLNVTAIETGHDKFNIVCGQLAAKMDLRFASSASLNQFHQYFESNLKAMSQVAVNGQMVRGEFSLADDCPAMEQSTHPLTHEISEIFGQYERQELKLGCSGGAADINYFSNGNNICLDGLGPRGGLFHRKDEFIMVDSLLDRTMALAHTLKVLHDIHRQRGTYDGLSQIQQ